MTTLKDFVDTYIPRQHPLMRDYTGPRGWAALCNQALRRLEMEGFIPFQRKEAGFEVSNGYWINLPADYRSALKLTESTGEIKLRFGIVNGKIKLQEYVARDKNPVTYVLSFGSATGVTIDSADAVVDEFAGSLLIPTNGVYAGEGILIGEHAAASLGVTDLSFVTPRSSIADSTAGYITLVYVMGSYMATFTPVAASDDDLPIDARYQHLLINGLCYLASPIESKERAAYFQEFEYDIELVKRDTFTPTPEQARPISRPMAAFDCAESNNHSEFVGDENAWLED